MRSLMTAVMIAVVAGCATPRISVGSVVERVAENEIAAARSTQGFDVLAKGTIRDITFLIESELETDGTGSISQGAFVSSSTTRKRRNRAPYVSLFTPDGTAVFCFPKEENVAAFDSLRKGTTASLVGTFHSAKMVGEGNWRVTLGDCRVAD